MISSKRKGRRPNSMNACRFRNAFFLGGASKSPLEQTEDQRRKPALFAPRLMAVTRATARAFGQHLNCALQTASAAEQYQLFETSQYKYRVFVTDMRDPISFVVWFYGQRGGAENLIKEANNDAGLAAHPSGRFDVNSNHSQMVSVIPALAHLHWVRIDRTPQKPALADGVT